MKNPFKKYICIKQHDLKDCGAACLATISKQYGLKIPISKIREVAGTDKEGTSAYGIIKAAEQLGFSAKGVKVSEPEDIFSEFPLPCIAHVVIDGSFLHYVVIHKITQKEILIADPGKGIVKYRPEDFFKIWTGVLILMAKTAEFKKGDETKGLFSRFFGLIEPQRTLILNIFFTSLIFTLLGILGAFYFQLLVDEVLQYNLLTTLHILSIGFIMLNIFKILLNAFRSQLLMYLAQRIDIPLMLGYYEHVINLPMNFFGTRKVGEIVSRFNDATKIREAISGATLTIMIDTLMAIAGAVILFMQNRLLFGITVIPVILYAIIVWGFKKPIQNINRENMENNASITSYLVESLSGIETIKAFNAEREVNGETEKRFVKLMKSAFKTGLIGNVQGSIKGAVKSIFGVVILWIGGYECILGVLSVGQLLAFNSLLAYFLDPIENLINLQSQLQTAIVAADRLGEILDLELEKSENESKKINPSTLKGSIEFKDVDFRYGTRKLILEGLNLTIQSGEKIALVGESGSGKTTLSKLIMNFYQCEKGEVLINGYNIKDINIEALRNKIACISQDIFLFSGTIKENLLFGQEDIEFEKVVDACKRARIHDFINEQPLRYETMIEENGSNLSGGQKQRIAIARALIREPEILIMDEATSSLDSITEKAIEKTMYEFSQNITTIIIAHRLSTIMRCNKIYVMDKGKLIEGGSHNELIDKKGRYFNLWKDQMPEYFNNEVALAKEIEVNI
ncbi:peptidase domain-containing ABC transporter [Clostridium saccharobutylicum]|uniref:Lactococcin-G-processing and transport ATP-binding protein LagD n=1 Tax=Clostridium saccharobutylicum DSM 13864 TaxID=1345695 RepID=U5MNA3_CLOSA|nr:peptidase domain-containing ABC transporter [Clostridium saccharobutylicum]AGX41988.1 lactococcin-G-processing and transport ATP-binding protein LagD [Clostridium saccharobutylicum DSM 13864]AQR89267.1 lactococcin-G-processing and transport ATP-binding protein LagD [Clostridium saccharobutylicum]AQR99168.1 lactococcin-G-processing and transport ATP-binding protein LagD [Clostridium saccharobutylicum]AQS13156.1 lactococcin-G-processing and transport ATP-binding protein LagD [Clostridium sacch